MGTELMVTQDKGLVTPFTSASVCDAAAHLWARPPTDYLGHFGGKEQLSALSLMRFLIKTGNSAAEEQTPHILLSYVILGGIAPNLFHQQNLLPCIIITVKECCVH